MQGLGPLFVFFIIVLVVANTIKLLREWERGVVLRLGKFQAVRGPGITFVIPGIERMYRVNTRVITVDVPPQDIITKDNITLKVHAVVFFHIFSPKETIINVEDWYSATYQKAQTVLRNVLGQFELDDLLAQIRRRLGAVGLVVGELLFAQRRPYAFKDGRYVLRLVSLGQLTQHVGENKDRLGRKAGRGPHGWRTTASACVVGTEDKSVRIN